MDFLAEKVIEEIASILFSSGESFIDDDGVDWYVCKKVAEEIYDKLERMGVIF